MEICNVSIGGYASNTYLVIRQNAAVLIDCSADPDLLRRELQRRGVQLLAVLLTHGHYDHYMTVHRFKEVFDVPFYLHEGDADFPGDGVKNCYHVFHREQALFPAADRLVRDGDVPEIGPFHVTVMHTPGHTPGSVCYRIGDALFTGDTLFACGHGRVTFPGGNARAMRESLDRLSEITEDLHIYPGHDQDTDLAAALHFNKYRG